MQLTVIYVVGDFRMYVGEDRNKVSNIVNPNLAAFKALYKSHLEQMVVFTEEGVVKKVSLHSIREKLCPWFTKLYNFTPLGQGCLNLRVISVRRTKHATLPDHAHFCTHN